MKEPTHEWPRHKTPEQKIAGIEKQIAECERGTRVTLVCPYCDRVTVQGETLCCMTMGKAVRAILQRQTTQELADNAAQIAEAVSRN